MVIDCCLLFNELDMLELRFEELSPVVDRFVVVESTRTFQGDTKPLYLRGNLERFEKFISHLTYIVVDEEPQPEAGYDFCWSREHLQRNAIMRGLAACSDDDIALISDIDEIPSRAAVRELSGLRVELRDYPLFFLQELRYYFFDCQPYLPLWDQAYAATVSFLRKNSPQDTRINYGAFSPRRWILRGTEYGGWHFSYFGGAQAIRDKLLSFSHTEFNRTDLTDVPRITERISALSDPCGRSYKLECRLNPTLPEHVTANREKYERMGWFCPPVG